MFVAVLYLTTDIAGSGSPGARSRARVCITSGPFDRVQVRERVVER
jgi:hypothetical protein